MSAHAFTLISTELTCVTISKYLVGADGGKSPVRKAAKIPFVGEGTGASWIRMDVRDSDLLLKTTSDAINCRLSLRPTCLSLAN